MANLKVISNRAYRNYSTQPRNDWRQWEVREDEGSYNGSTNDLFEKMKALLGKPLWPEFSDGTYLSPEAASRLYRLAHGVQGLIHILNQSINARRIAHDFDDESSICLNEFLESQIWAALVEVGKGLVAATNELDDFQHAG